jgi:hypothetical protein
VLLDPERLERGLDAFLEAEKEKAGGDPEKEARVFTNKIAEVDRKRAAYQDMVADGLMERGTPGEARRPLALEDSGGGGAQSAGAAPDLAPALLQLSRDKILARYREAAPEELEKADGKKRRAVYNTLGVTVWAARTKEDPIRIVFSALGGEEVCRSDVTSTR